METFFVSEMEVFTDSKVSQSAEMASIHVHVHDLPTHRVVQDYRENSVLGSFSKVGGLWAFLGGAFATIFGCSILRTVLGMSLSLLSSCSELNELYSGMKPLSVFGVMHSFQEKEICMACADKYPRLQNDIKMPPTDRGLLSFVSDQIFELNFLVAEEIKVRDNHSKANAPAQEDDVEKQADPDDDRTWKIEETSLLPEAQPLVSSPLINGFTDVSAAKV